jgi:hypothetical protein
MKNKSNHFDEVSLQIVVQDGMPLPPESLNFRKVVCKLDGGQPLKCGVCGGEGKFLGRKCVRCQGNGVIIGIPAIRKVVHGTASAELIQYLDELNQWCANNGIDYDDIASINIPLYESGGFNNRKDGGIATVICGLRQEKLRSYHYNLRPFGPHAFFWVEVALAVQVRHDPSMKHGQGRVLLISIDEDAAYDIGVRKRVLYFFKFDPQYNLSETPKVEDVTRLSKTRVEFPENVAIAAVRKSMDPGCTKAYWATGEYAQ